MSVTQPEDGFLSCKNWSSNNELNGTQEPFGNPYADYDDDEFLQFLWREYLHPKQYEWVLIAGYIIVFLVALIGNILGKSQSAFTCLLYAYAYNFGQHTLYTDKALNSSIT